VTDRSLLDPILLTSSVLQLANMAPGVLATGSLGFGNTISNTWAMHRIWAAVRA
jgi:hypothetical protein